MTAKTTDPEPRSLLTEVLCSLTDFCTRHARLTLWVVLLSAVGCIAYTSQVMKFKTDRSDLIDPSASFQQRWLRYTESFGESADIVVVVESKEPETIKQVLDAIGGRLKAQPDLFRNILFKVEPGKLLDKGLQYLSPDQLIAGLERLDEYRPILNGHWELVRLEGMLPRLQSQLKRLHGTNEAEASLLLHHADLLTSSLAASLRDRDDFTNPWPDVLPVDPKMRDQENQTVYLLNDAGTMGFVMASPVTTNDTFEGATVAIDKLRQLIRQVGREFPDARILLTGIPVLENDEMRRSMSDSTTASIVSFVGVAVLMFLGFRGFLHPLLGLFMLAVSMAWSFGYTTAVVGHLNILSVSFAAMLMGLGIDFAIHVLSRYLELRHEGRSLNAALVETTGSIGVGIVTGAVTTSLAFFCATFTEFLGVAELGIIAGGGILLCAFAAFTILPAAIALADRNTEPRGLPTPFQGRSLRHATKNHPWLVLCASLACMGYIGYRTFDWTAGVPKPLVTYDHNLLHLQAVGLESVEAQKHIFDSSQHSLLYAISLAESPEQARELKRKFEALPTVHHVQELASRMPSSPVGETKLLVQGFHAHLARLPEQPPQPAPTNPATVGRALNDFYKSLKDRPEVVSRRIVGNLDEFLNSLDKMPLRDQMTFFGEFQYRMSYALLAQFQAIAAASNPEPVTTADLPPELKDHFVSPQGRWLLQVYPKDQVWDMEPLERFVTEIRSVDPEVTGTPLQNFEAARQIKQSYEICAMYALVVILITLLLDFSKKQNLLWTFVPPLAAVLAAGFVMQQRNIAWNPAHLVFAFTAMAFAVALILDWRAVSDTLLAMIPPVIGMAITFGLLVILDIPLNPANLIILPLILGIGVDNGVHILHDFHAKPNRIFSTSPSIINAIMLTSTTTMVGFGSLMISAHRGLYSLGAVLTIGVGACLFVSLVTLPAILTIVSRHRGPGVEASLETVLTPAALSDDSFTHEADPSDEMLTDDDEPPATIKMPGPSRVA